MTTTAVRLGFLVGLAIVASSAEARSPRAHDGAGAGLTQYTSRGHVLGFGTGRYYVSNGAYALTVEFVDAAPVVPTGPTGPTGKAAGGATGAAAPLARVTYAGLWEGISVEYDAPQVGIARSTWRLEPGAEPRAIRMRYNRPVRLSPDGTLTVEIGERGVLTETAPVAWQDANGERRPVQVAFVLEDGELGFALGAYDREQPLVIDPTLFWNTFLGGSATDRAEGIAVDGSGDVYVVGTSGATWGGPVRLYTANDDAFAAKLDEDGALVWSTFLGGTGDDEGAGVAVDGSGHVYIAGESAATWGTPVRPFTAPNRDAFAAELDAAGEILWNTFLGAGAGDEARGVAVDGSGNVYLAGWSGATWETPILPHTAVADAFAAKLDGNGGLLWNTFLGGAGSDLGHAIALDGSANVYVAGSSEATWGTPVLAHTGGGTDAFAAMLDTDGALQWNTFLGGTGLDIATGIGLDGSGNVYLGGESGATWGSPVRAYTAKADAFAAKLDASGVLLWNTFLGGTEDDFGVAIAVDVSGRATVTGSSEATWGSPVHAYTTSTSEAFVAQVDASGTLLWNTFLGGSGNDQGNGITVDSDGSVYVAGVSTATWGSPLRAFTSSGSDAFVAKLGELSLLDIPTLGSTGIALLVLLLGAAAAMALRRRAA